MGSLVGGECAATSRSLKRIVKSHNACCFETMFIEGRAASRSSSTGGISAPQERDSDASIRRRRPKGGQLSLREVSKELAARGFFNELGKPYAAKSVASMLR